MRKLLLLAVLCAAPSFAVITATGTPCILDQQNSTTAVCTMSVTAGNQLIALNSNYFNALSTIADNANTVCPGAGNDTFALISSISTGASWLTRMYKVDALTCTGSITITATYASASANPGPNLAIQQYNGMGTQDGGVVSGAVTPSGFIYTCATIPASGNTSNANDIIIAALSVPNHSSGSTVTVGSPFTERTVANGAFNQGLIADDIVTSVGSFTAVFTRTTITTTAGCISVAFKSSASAVPTRHKVVIQ
jgi:hypothetical protein